MGSLEPALSSDKARHKGNDFYKSGKLVQGKQSNVLYLKKISAEAMIAVTLYQQAAELDPSSAAPHSNLAAVYFELGDYAAAILACDSASALLSERLEHEATRCKLAFRKAKACLHTKQFREALAVLTTLPLSDEKDDLERCLQLYENSQSNIVDIQALHEKLLQQVPRYKPAM